MIPVAWLGGGIAGGGLLTLALQRLWKHLRKDAPPPKPNVAVDRWNDDTVRLIYEEAKEYEKAVLAWSDTIDVKVTAIFGIASLAVTFAATGGKVPTTGLGHYLWIGTIVLWGLCVGACFMAFRTREFLLGPHPRNIFTSSWTEKAPTKYYIARLKSMLDPTDQNRQVALDKAKWLNVSTILAVLELTALLAVLWPS